MSSELGIGGSDSRGLSVPNRTVRAMTTWTRAEIGALGEQLAVDHLTSLGLRVLATARATSAAAG